MLDTKVNKKFLEHLHRTIDANDAEIIHSGCIIKKILSDNSHLLVVIYNNKICQLLMFEFKDGIVYIINYQTTCEKISLLELLKTHITPPFIVENIHISRTSTNIVKKIIKEKDKYERYSVGIGFEKIRIFVNEN